MRIVAGNYRSRIIKAVPGENTRPTLDKVKEAVFSRIGPYFNGGDMLDLFAGSGNMGIEAQSRGMKHIIFCDAATLAIKTIQANINTLKMDDYELWKSDYMNALKRCVIEKKQFDLIYLDPPYDLGAIKIILEFIDEHQLLKEDGNLICETLKNEILTNQYQNLKQIKEATYGISKITYYRGQKI
ncbi:MAG: 16S rRNA (guanine(966)-N(2))-methyltransferase RsmD [Erysipelotrichaceae bacterium]